MVFYCCVVWDSVFALQPVSTSRIDLHRKFLKCAVHSCEPTMQGTSAVKLRCEPVCHECRCGFCSGTPLKQAQLLPSSLCLTPELARCVTPEHGEVDVSDLGLETGKRLYFLRAPHVMSWEYLSPVINELCDRLVSDCCTSKEHLRCVSVTGLLIRTMGLCCTR